MEQGIIKGVSGNRIPCYRCCPINTPGGDNLLFVSLSLTLSAGLPPMRMQIFQVDAFATRRFTGNPAAVMPMDRFLDDAVL
jgi:hypothetical protein